MSLLGLAAKAAPALAKQLPKLWPLLLEKRNRQRLTQIVTDLMSQSPKKKLQGRIELTASLADALSEKASDEQERKLAAEWSHRAANLRLRLDLPIQGRQARKEHRASIRAQLDGLQTEMNNYLDGQVDVASDSSGDGNGVTPTHTDQLPKDRSRA